MNHLKSKLAFFALVFLALGACEGPAGPTGPEGPSGPGTRIVFLGTLDAVGIGAHTLPPEAGDADEPPGATCWVSDDGIVWFQISCVFGVEFDGSLVIFAVGNAEDAGLRYRIVVVY